jgi:hypothetical protein
VTRAVSRSGIALALLALFALLPFALVHWPSMTDLAGHIGRYHVMMEHDRSPWLRLYYSFEWRLVGNLGADLIVRGLAPWLGVERASWLMAAAIAPFTLLGIAAVSRAAYGRVQPGAVLAGLFVMSNPLMYGFVNFCVSYVFALFAFAAWIALRERAWWRQMLATLPLVFLTWLAHAMGWGVLLVMIAGFELERLARRRTGEALLDGGLRALVFVPPILLTVLWRGDSQGVLYYYGTEVWTRKYMNWVVVLRGEAKWIDVGTPVLVVLVVLATLWRRAQAIDWRLASGGLLLALATLAMPMTVMGSWGADERMVPTAVIALLLALRWTGSPRTALAVIGLALALFAVRAGMIARSWVRFDTAYTAALRDLDAVPTGARVFSLVFAGCGPEWRASLWTHVPSLALVRRDALVNSIWYLPGAAMLKVIYPIPPEFRNDPAQQVSTTLCGGGYSLDPLHERIAKLDTRQWDYLWVLRTAGATDLWPGHRPIRTSPESALFKIAH